MDLEHPEIGCIERTGYPSCEQENAFPTEEDYETEFWGSEYEDRLYEEARERDLFRD